MMKIRSKALWKYLEETGVLHGTEADIARAKREYRRLYKKAWKQRRVKRCELRPIFTMLEFEAVLNRAKQAGVKPAVFAREVILQAATSSVFIQNKDELLRVLQLISITAVELSKDESLLHLLQQIETAERKLLLYLHHDT